MPYMGEGLSITAKGLRTMRIPTLARRSAAAAAAGALLAAAAPALPASDATSDTASDSGSGAGFGAESFTLSNGMQVVAIPNRRAPLVHHAVWYKVGAADEPPGKSGVAHVVEHLMFKGTETVPGGEFSNTVARHGGDDNAFTSQDYTGYYQNIAADRLALVMRLEADRMVNLTFDETDFTTEISVVLEERRSRVDNRPSARFGEQVAAAQFLSHPYGLPVIGWEHEIRGLTREDAMAFYRAHYAPDNAVLVVAGDVDPAALKTLAEEIFGAIPPAGAPPRARPSEPPQIAARRLSMSDPRVSAREWSRRWLAPSYAADPDGISVALDVLSSVLGGGTTSRLYRTLAVERGLATHAGSYYSGSGRDYGLFAIRVLPKPEADIAEVEAVVEEEIARLVADGPTEEELERAKFGIRAFAVYSRDSLGTLGRIFGAALTAGLTTEDVERWPDEVAAIDGAAIAAAARAALRPERSVTALLEPEEAGGEAQP